MSWVGNECVRNVVYKPDPRGVQRGAQAQLGRARGVLARQILKLASSNFIFLLICLLCHQTVWLIGK